MCTAMCQQPGHMICNSPRRSMMQAGWATAAAPHAVPYYYMHLVRCSLPARWTVRVCSAMLHCAAGTTSTQTCSIRPHAASISVRHTPCQASITNLGVASQGAIRGLPDLRPGPGSVAAAAGPVATTRPCRAVQSEGGARRAARRACAGVSRARPIGGVGRGARRRDDERHVRGQLRTLALAPSRCRR